MKKGDWGKDKFEKIEIGEKSFQENVISGKSEFKEKTTETLESEYWKMKKYGIIQKNLKFGKYFE